MNIHMKLWLTILTRLLTLTARITKDPGLKTRLWEAADDLKPRRVHHRVHTPRNYLR